jgi:hypothetical protein
MLGGISWTLNRNFSRPQPTHDNTDTAKVQLNNLRAITSKPRISILEASETIRTTDGAYSVFGQDALNVRIVTLKYTTKRAILSLKSVFHRPVSIGLLVLALALCFHRKPTTVYASPFNA